LSTAQSALQEAGIACRKQVELDGRLHRFKADGDHDENSWYVFHQSGDLVIGAFGCWKRQFTKKWCSKPRQEMTKEQWNQATESWKTAESDRKREEVRLQSEARARAGKLFSADQPPPEHPYLEKKGIQAHGKMAISDEERTRGWLALPLQDEKGVIHSAQFIAEDGTKRFLYGGRVQGCFFALSSKATGPLVICEGYATGASIHEATGWATVCAMNCGNMAEVARQLRMLYPARTIVIAADNDQFTEGNPGLEKARAAATATKSILAAPEFGDECLAEKPTDFNDLHLFSGIGEVRLQINRSFSIIARPVGDFQLPPENDPTELLKHRYLCERGGMLITGPTGVGKSSFIMQALALWSNGLPCFGITPNRPLTSVLIQAENDDGDIAEMRNGVATGLRFNEKQRKAFFERVLVHSSTGITGQKFCQEVASPLLDLHDPNLFVIEPALSFFGGDVKEQKDVGNFLRQYLNPVVYAHKCAVIITHHTNKPKSGKDDNAPQNGDWAYQGSGSAEWANWARAVLSLQSSGTPGVYKLHAGKRGARLGWRTDADEVLWERIIVHSKEKGVICWEDGDNTDLPERGRKKAYNDSEVIDLLGESGLATDEWCSAAQKELGMSRATFHRAKKNLLSSSQVLKSKINSKWVSIRKAD
jgi:phage/plasmid primase-like uncharacterized protein